MATKPAHEDGGGAKAVERLVAIINVLAEEGRPLGIGEVAEGTNLPQATVHRLLNAFAVPGWVEKDPATSRYRLGNGLLGPAAAALTHSPLVERAQPILNRLSEVLGTSVLIGVLVGRNVIYVSWSTATGETTTLRPGITRPAHCSASGKVLLAFLSPDERRRIFRGRTELRGYTPNTITSVQELEQQLESVRKLGYAYEVGEYREYLRGVAVPIHDPRGKVVAALGTFGRTERLTDERMVLAQEEMGAQAEELSRQSGLGYD